MKKETKGCPLTLAIKIEKIEETAGKSYIGWLSFAYARVGAKYPHSFLLFISRLLVCSIDETEAVCPSIQMRMKCCGLILICLELVSWNT